MNTTQSRPKMSRRDFLRLLTAGGVTVAGGYALYEFTPWLDYESLADQVWTLKENDPKRNLIHYATLAANGHNTQPWKFVIQENAIEIHPDYSRELKVVDPDHRELWISLGCALENLLVAARTIGFAPIVTYPDSTEVIRVDLTPDAPQTDPMFDAIPLRQNTRSEYDGQVIAKADFDQIQALPLEPGIFSHFITSPGGMETVLDYVNQGNLSQYADIAFVDELIDWLRFNKKDALASMDGLYSVCSGNPEVPGWLGRMFVAGTKPGQQADVDAKKLRSSPVAVVIASEADDTATWVRTGQVYERLALKATSLNVKSAFLNQPIEVASLRSQFQSALGLGAFMPQLLIRLGYAEAMPKSLRRPVDTVLI